MRAIRHLLALVALAFAATTASAQFVKGNEAVKVMPDGTKKIETAPLPTTGPIRSTKPCNADAGCNAGPWHMVETNDGLVECTEAYARGWRQLPWPVGDNYLGRLKAQAGRVREAGLP